MTTEIHPVIQDALAQVRPKATLASLMIALEQMESVLDCVGEITRDMVQEHFDAYTAVDEKTDKLIGFINRLKLEAAAASEKSEAYKAKAKAYEASLERVKEYSKWLLQRFPDIEYRGTKGKLALQRIQPKLIITIPQHRFSSERVIPSEMVQSIPDTFRKLNVIWTIDTDALRDSLKNGNETPIARLEESSSVRIRL